MSRSTEVSRSRATGWLVAGAWPWLRRGRRARAIPLGALVLLVIVVQRRGLAGLDAELLRWLDLRRAADAAPAMNWAFRLGFAQVDATVALAWSALLAARHRSLAAGRAPLALCLVIGVEVGLRLMVRQPPPNASYGLLRPFSNQPVSRVLDQTDAASRQTLGASVAGSAPATDERDSFPSGHAARALFLAMLLGFPRGRRVAKQANPASRPGLAVQPLAIAALALAAVIGYSALFFGYHWPSDVLGGYLVALVVWQGASALGWLTHGPIGRTFPVET